MKRRKLFFIIIHLLLRDDDPISSPRLPYLWSRRSEEILWITSGIPYRLIDVSHGFTSRLCHRRNFHLATATDLCTPTRCSCGIHRKDVRTVISCYRPASQQRRKIYCNERGKGSAGRHCT